MMEEYTPSLVGYFLVLEVWVEAVQFSFALLEPVFLSAQGLLLELFLP